MHVRTDTGSHSNFLSTDKSQSLQEHCAQVQGIGSKVFIKKGQEEKRPFKRKQEKVGGPVEKTGTKLTSQGTKQGEGTRGTEPRGDQLWRKPHDSPWKHLAYGAMHSKTTDRFTQIDL